MRFVTADIWRRIHCCRRSIVTGSSKSSSRGKASTRKKIARLNGGNVTGKAYERHYVTVNEVTLIVTVPIGQTVIPPFSGAHTAGIPYRSTLHSVRTPIGTVLPPLHSPAHFIQFKYRINRFSAGETSIR